ncbi:biopolymer transporter ExbD [Crocosphaera sp. UHCC 0190]|uniref:ExbD/TolR family protein n=1 Tax=Crocosphaera sp. UHCC 0190 TaxID=3110246 RepID=UPI002B21A9FE|nr:biopolymer transporter ExbD [Crocosphaera sp. UHCC 0190]MEA5509768.1 biopolymer transporter ExbD [Crocosphaera sp. UHCC 0190]
MRFKQQRGSSIPEVNLVPMIDVMMSVLIFFIITSITLTGQNLGNINLPNSSIKGESSQNKENPKTLIVGLNNQGKILMANQTFTEPELITKIEDFLSKNPSGQVIIKADKKLSYQQISIFLKKIGTVSDRSVFLAIDDKK